MDVYQEIVHLRQQGRRGALATIVAARGAIPSFTSAKMLVREDGSICGTVGGGMVEGLVIQTARKVMEAGKAQTLSFNLHDKPEYDAGMVCGGALDILIKPVLPPPVLYIFGAGHIGLNVYKAGHFAGFDVIVIDERPAFANRERFPDAREIIAETWDRAMARVEPGCSSFIVIVTPGHQTDTRILSWLAVDREAELANVSAAG
jgi:xanthine dehydrogenase accessory factor